jgi:hypothetical protein
MTTPEINLRKLRRRLLEEVQEFESKVENLPFTALPATKQFSPKSVLDQLRILQHEGRVALKELPTGPHEPLEAVVTLTPLGLKSLEQDEDHWEVSQRPSMKTTTATFNNSQVGNFAQVVDAQNVRIHQSSGTTEMKDVFAAIDGLIEKIHQSPQIAGGQKNDLALDAGQLKSELQKSTPNKSRITEYLSSLSALKPILEFSAQIPALIEKVQGFLKQQ